MFNRDQTQTPYSKYILLIALICDNPLRWNQVAEQMFRDIRFH